MTVSLSVEINEVAAKLIDRPRLPLPAGLVSSDDFCTQLENAFLAGVHELHTRIICAELKGRHQCQQDGAELLGWKSRTSIPKAFRSGKIDGVRLSAALYRLGTGPFDAKKELLPVFGFSAATSFLRQQDKPDGAVVRMTPVEWVFALKQLFSNWSGVAADKDYTRIRQLGSRIVSETKTALPASILSEGESAVMTELTSAKPEQRVHAMTGILLNWGDLIATCFFHLAHFLPDAENVR